MNNIINIQNINISNDLPFILIAGPCQIETLDHTLYLAKELVTITSKHNIPFIFKASFDKANRTSSSSPRGVGLDKGLSILSEVKKEFNCPVLTDVHTSNQCAIVAQVVDILQIPAFLCRQTDLIKSAAETQKIINIKKGQFLAPWDMKNVFNKLISFGNKNGLLTERGTCFGYNNLVSDMRSIAIMSDIGAPVIFDATHSVQQPGGFGNKSGGERRFVELLARAAISVGIAGLYLEVHEDPDNAPSDGPCMLKLINLEKILLKIIEYDRITKTIKD